MTFLTALFKKKLLDSKLLEGATDVHCHILPGVDDGIQTLEHSLEVLKYYEEMGYKRIVCTPHVMAEWNKNNTAFLTEQFNAFKSKTPKSIELRLAAEYMLDARFLDHLKEETLLSYDGKHVLVETSYLAPSPIMGTQLYELRLAGYEPILAHPERYVYMRQAQYDKLKKEGVKFQLNLLSLMGAYGSGAKEKAEKLLRMGYYDFVGTDTHRPKWLKRGVENFVVPKSTLDRLKPLFENSVALVDGKLKK